MRASLAGRGERNRGFTVIELMIVVAIIAVLAAIVIPAWNAESKRGRTDPEISSMFTQIATSLEQFKSEQGSGSYASGLLPSPLGPCPASPTPSGANWNATCPTLAGWSNLRISAPESTMYCTYAITTGAAGTAPAPPSGFTMTTPAGSWWFVVGTCDMDGKGAPNATFFRSSVDTKLQKLNYGQ
jgi:prepilin-type N-terminal cleavage/methylation domain-containing protein